jgi:hypothetical protein
LMALFCSQGLTCPQTVNLTPSSSVKSVKSVV